MITSAERALIRKHAYLPEHLPDYVHAISSTEPFLIDDFVMHRGAGRLVLVGYPLRGDWCASRLVAALEAAKTRFDPGAISLIAPELPPLLNGYSPSTPDSYYRLDLADLAVPKKIRNMLRRAGREVTVTPGEFGREHKRLAKAFLRGSQFDKGTHFIFQHIHPYAKCESVRLYEARDARGKLVAFDLADFGTRDYAFYMFNIRSQKNQIPGVSDLLLSHIIERARQQGKRYLNLGLGINRGVAFFKQKWGATPFLKYTTWEWKSSQEISLWEAFDRLSG